MKKYSLEMKEHFNAVSLDYEKRFLSSNCIFTDTAQSFMTMNFDEQTAIINATLTNTAKLINSKQTADGTETYSETKAFRDALVFLWENKDECFNEAYCLCLEHCYDSMAENMPLALFVTKMSGRALRKAFYWNSKSASELWDDEAMVNCADCFDGYDKVFQTDRIEQIIKNIRDSMKVYARDTIYMMISGYNTAEIARHNGIDEKRQRTVNAVIMNAVALVNLDNKEWSELDRICASDKSLKDKVSRIRLEQAIIEKYKNTLPAYNFIGKQKIISWQNALDRLKAKDYYDYEAFKARVNAQN